MDIKESDAKIRDMEHIIEEKEREIQMLRDSIHEYNNINPVNEERVIQIERDLKEIDGLIRGLTAEMLDLKACVQKLSKSMDEKPVRKTDDIKSKNYPTVESPKVVAERKTAEKSLLSNSSKVEEEEEPEEALIIQPDGTMKRETKFGDEMIVADNRGGRVGTNLKRRPGERDPIDRKPLIYADDDDDTVEIKRKRR
ncbi:hypothetical protein L1994_07945 [Methanomicrobium antiquum]|uniref:Uncharacterized protein n=1 Tax=Methanomicrobium antiquum TaxID=487686 RepID=A0AAF0FP08_9EURY|nr:hypothetical protein [Methanomicrobium antiquum]MDD3977303.1 hypothetical protein [Methanomicrobium sp.]WFN36074.1 hypothetical protein L1994_07945 [Methanomicrobium antiquum]